jgi:glycosyltransferase involved in cell wall biosynthesis
MNSALRDRQALKRLRKMEQSVALRVGEHITRSIVQIWRLPILPLTFSLLCLRIGLEKMGLISPPEPRIDWQHEVEGKGLLVFVDGYTSTHVSSVKQDIEDIFALRNDVDVAVVCTSRYQEIFSNTDFPVFVLPEKYDLSSDRIDDWGVLLEEQIGGISSFFQPSMALVIGPYPHRPLKNLVRANSALRLIHDQRPRVESRKKYPSQVYTHLSGVLRSSLDRDNVPDTVTVHRVDKIGMASWLSDVFESIDDTKENTFAFNKEVSTQLIEIARNADRDTNKISDSINEINYEYGIEKTYALLMFTLINFERQDETQDKKHTRDLFVAAIRSLGRTNFEHMLELAAWRLHRYQDERAAKSVIQFLRNAERVEEAMVYLKYVKDEEWKKREVRAVTSRMLAQYGIKGDDSKHFESIKPSEVEAIVLAELEQGSFHRVKLELSLAKGGVKRKAKVLQNILKATVEIHNSLLYDLILEHGLFEHDSIHLARRLNTFFLLYGDTDSAMLALELGPIENLESEKQKTLTITAKIDHTWLSSIGPLPVKPSFESKPDTVLYLAHMALPFESAGYCTRTHGLLTNLSSFNPEVSVQTRLGYPLDKGKLRHLEEDDVKPQFAIDGLVYGYEQAIDPGITDSDERAYIERATLALIERARLIRPALIQAASNHVNGAIGLTAARALGLPFVYEVRGLWHMSRVARQPFFLHHSNYQAMDEAELAICKEADVVLAITHAVRHYLIGKGIAAERILVLPNGVDTHRFTPIEPDQTLKAELNIGEGTIIGYVGSFVKYEGLNLLVEAFAKLRENQPNVYLLLVGDGETRNELEVMVDQLDIRDYVRFTGRVPHDDVNRYHSIIDIAPFPRTPDIVCEFISPLKPFESMAMGQVVVGSDVAALREIITDGEHGRLFKKGDSHDLFEVLTSLVSNPEEMIRLKSSGLDWVKEHRDWSKLASYLHKVHNAILADGELPELMGSGQTLTILNGKVSTVIQGKPNLMVIMDEFSTTALSADAHLIRPTPENWQNLLDEGQIDMLVVESAWEGNNGAWHHKVGWYSEDEIADLKNLVEACKDRNIPTVFYNKEDPVHFNRFSKTSTLFDHVFTTDEDCINRYQALKNSSIQSVDWIQFAAQPDVHHPYDVMLSERDGIAFAGTYYAGKYPERCEKMDMLFDASANHGLIIYNRQSDGGNPQYVFPDRFTPFLRNKLEYQEMLQKHREHQIFLNVNSVEDSLTMAARRIFEIPASGACLVSGPGLAVREVFGNTVPMVYSSEQANETLAALMADEEFLRYTIQATRRLVLKDHLNTHRLQKMLNASSLTLQRPSSVANTVIVSDTSASIRDICLWFARQEIEFTHLVLPSNPTTKAEELLVKLLQHRGLTVSFDYLEPSDSPFIHIHKVLAFGHHGLDMLFREMQSTPHTIHFKSSNGEVLATCKQIDSEFEVTLEHLVSPSTPHKLISTITEHTFDEVPSTILVAGHDLKFAMPIIEVMEEMGIRVLIDKWVNHNRFNAEKSRTLLKKADAVWCEWALGNVDWYSHNINPGTPLFVRYHLQERNYEYLNNSKQQAISNVAFVCKHYEENARAIGQIQETTMTSVIPNVMNIRGTYPRKNDNYSIGFVGMVPARKRLDLAIDLLEELLQQDPRYKLKVVGKNPEEYDWLMKRDEEREYYQTIRTRVESNPMLKSRIEFLGFVDDIREFYSSVGHVISTSDFESYHLTLADGPLHGAAAHSLRWDGADSIYTKSWLNETISEIAESIRVQNIQNTTAFEAEKQSYHLVPQMSSEIVALSIIQALLGVPE